MRRSNFSCGNTELDRWLRTHASQAERDHTARTFLAVDEDELLVGYYSLTTYRLALPAVMDALGHEEVRYPKSALLLARLAIDRLYQRQGIGSEILVDAFIRACLVSNDVAFEWVIVEAIDSEAANFYRRNGFTPFNETPLRLFIKTKDIQRHVRTRN